MNIRYVYSDITLLTALKKLRPPDQFLSAAKSPDISNKDKVVYFTDKKNNTLLTVAIAIFIMIVLASIFAGSKDEKQQDKQQTEQKTVITVSASAVMTEAFNEIEKEFEADNSEIDLIMNFGNAGSLRMQIEGGAPIDVFAPADVIHMDMLASKGLVYNDSRKEFAESTLVMIVPKGNVLNLTSIEDLSKPEVKKIALSDTEASTVGRYTKQSLMEEDLWNSVQNKLLTGDTVKSSLVYVERGEADAGFVFMTDVSSAQPGTVEVVASVPVSTPIIYPIAVVSATPHTEESKLFIDFVTGEKGRFILEKYGFSIPQNG